MRRLVRRSKLCICTSHQFDLGRRKKRQAGDRSDSVWVIVSNVSRFRQVSNDDIKSTTGIVRSTVTSVPFQAHLACSSTLFTIHSSLNSFASFHTSVLFQSNSRDDFRSCSEVIHLPTPTPFVRSYVYAEALASRIALAEPWAAYRAFRRN